MIIGIDGYESNVAHRVGIGRYAYEIVTHLYSVLKKRKKEQKKIYGDISVTVYVPQKPRDDMPKSTPWWSYTIVPSHSLWTWISLPIELLSSEHAPHVFFSPTHYIPRFISIPRVMSIMDTSYLAYPELFKVKDLLQLVRWTAYSARHAKKIITISQFSKNAIINHYHIPSDNVVVTYPGYGGFPMEKHTPEAIIQKFHIAKHYILSVGTLQPRKNYVRLIEAFSKFLEKNKQKFGVIDLVIVGKKGWLYEEIIRAPKQYGVQNRVKFLDFVSDQDLKELYTHALCFALPSLYEGFGLPVLEAMAHQCPVVISRTSSLPEIAGKAGIYVDPESVDSITEGLLAAIRQRNLLQGTYRIKKGLEQVQLFSWDIAAKQTLDVLMQTAKPV